MYLSFLWFVLSLVINKGYSLTYLLTWYTRMYVYTQWKMSEVVCCQCPPSTAYTQCCRALVLAVYVINYWTAEFGFHEPAAWNILPSPLCVTLSKNLTFKKRENPSGAVVTCLWVDVGATVTLVSLYVWLAAS